MKIKLAIIGILLIGGIFSTQAQTSKKAIKRTQINQQKRISNGVKSGELTKGEVIRLQKQQVNIQKTKRKAAADGVVTRKEKAVIRKKQAKASRNITCKKNNNRN